MTEGSTPSRSRRREWTFLSNHAHVLVCIDRDPTIRTRDIATSVGITERATQAIVTDLVEAGYVTRTREGRWGTCCRCWIILLHFARVLTREKNITKNSSGFVTHEF